MYFKSVALVKKKAAIVLKSLGYNRVLFSLNISITKKKIYKSQCCLESKLKEYFLFVYFLVKAHKKAPAIPKFAEKKIYK